MKRAAAVSQIFVYIMTIIIVGLLLLFGFKYIGQILHKVEKVNLVQFKNEVETSFDRIRTCYDCAQVKDFRVPKGVKKVCFVDINKDGSITDICIQGQEMYSFVICDAWTTEDYKLNVLTDPMTETEIDVGPIDLGELHYLCFDTEKNPVFTLELTGLGDKTRISEYTEYEE